MSSNKDASLYGIPRPKKSADKELTSSTNLAFASQLSSLISAGSSSSKPSSAGRPRPKNKDDIFSVHNKNSRKRALKDLDDTDFTQRHSTSSETLDEATWKRSKRKMEEKARLYAAMKRGDVEDMDERYAVDFDRKWAEKHGKGESDTSSDEDADSEPEELVEYVDEFGRTRKGTRADVAREERRKKSMLDEPDRFTARPAMPSNIIYGDTIQSAAFNPDETVAEKMAEIAAKREDTPPKDTHFDGKAEIRNKGTGFFHFSQDEEERKKQMEELERERQETERRRAERERKKEDRKKEVEERRKALKEKRSKAQADKFLDGLMGELGDKAGEDTADSKDGGKEEAKTE
ncbi:hypothetical protein DIS24_g1634 [Lasiodiplodia hormozganensis]|uniref:Coiled-coil domain-containing protein 174 n=1 Tax=Lasiodiplodia hormozganensis TaxID=869390 RepID=A0AA39Z253_9PEZI|nr:hypothetical protein DIS24_g1634 [Lasiodiplodia hormozganensis]